MYPVIKELTCVFYEMIKNYALMLKLKGHYKIHNITLFSINIENICFSKTNNLLFIYRRRHFTLATKYQNTDIRFKIRIILLCLATNLNMYYLKTEKSMNSSLMIT